MKRTAILSNLRVFWMSSSDSHIPLLFRHRDVFFNGLLVRSI